MHSLKAFAVAAAVAALATVAVVGTASAAAAPVSVLTYGAPGPGGPNVAPGQVLTGNLQPGTKATFLTAPGGGVGTFCSVSNIGVQVLANPTAPGVAVSKLAALGFGGCVSTIPGSTVLSVTENNLPNNNVLFNDSAGFPVQFVPAGAPVQLTIVESVPGAVLNCVWQPVGSIYQGNYANPGNRLIVLNQKIQLMSGPPGPCGGTLQFMSFTYQPVVDSSVPGSPPVFVN
ncbi:conserved hypothetical protein [Catenulispora acidiphila DSM 44928]|uniref:Secreted protein n=2 Tax=Catenulispora TaxID=414878 RepID=C7PZZ4_CATAD|nr:conserved hypothetical protein [Catenulispora acidiphila DSM 44928]